MKNIILISILIIGNIIFCQETFSEKILIEKSNQIIEKYSERILTSEKKDTTYGSNFLVMTRYFDKEKKLVKRININPRSSLGFTGPRTEIYEANGRMIVAKNEDSSGRIWYLSINEYDNSGNLVKQTMFDMKFINTKLYEYDSDNELLKVSFYNNKGRKVNSEKRTKRKKQYSLN
ncbi:hypothetical protein [Psychroserpens algicola]|uniref:hypothetical protein n=1 Tax=Psychroserpens algicola TaxID=1719034 RepID=UPI0019537EC5|nr:hypothetical protein [Psychroserpens algicola]